MGAAGEAAETRPKRVLVIFDCDGVLVDSEPLANRLLAEMLSEVGLETSFEDSWRQYRGRSQAACIALAEEMLGRPLPPDFGSCFEKRLLEHCEDELQPVRGIEDALASLDRMAIQTCVASSGTHSKMRVTLAITSLYAHFEGRIFSATEVARSKPHPDIFLHAAQKMDVAPARCVVVEDSPNGVRAGLAAGMRVLGYAARDRAHDAALLEAAGATVFDDMLALPDLVAMQR